MRVLMYGWEFPPHNSGGLGNACFGLARSLVNEGIDLRFVLPRKYPVSFSGATMLFADEAHPLNETQARHFASGYINERQLSFLRGQYPELQYGPSLFDEVLRYAALSPLIALRNHPDVIHVHDWLCYPAGIAAKRATGAPLVVHVHATEFDRGGFVEQNAINEIERRGMYEADRIITVSEYTKNMVVQHYNVDPGKVDVVYNGIDADDSAAVGEIEKNVTHFKEAGWGVVLFVGRITMQKGPDYFLEAAKKVIEHRPKTLFILAGSGDMEKQIIDHAAYLGISDKVIFTGFVREKKLATLYRLADLFVLPSVSEPFGLVPLEALLNKTPVLLSKQSGVSEVLKHALKVDFWDVHAMASKIIAVLDHPSLQQTLYEEGEKEARTQVWSKVAKRCIMIYKSVVNTFTRSQV